MARTRTGPANLGGMGLGLRARGPAVRASRASMPSPRGGSGPGRPPMGGGVNRTGNPVKGSPRKINQPKTGRPGSFNRTPRADGASRI